LASQLCKILYLRKTEKINEYLKALDKSQDRLLYWIDEIDSKLTKKKFKLHPLFHVCNYIDLYGLLRNYSKEMHESQNAEIRVRINGTTGHWASH
jgi:hypothetical protein